MERFFNKILCIVCSSPMDIKEIKGLRTTYICSNLECEREFDIVEMDPELAKITNENFWDLI